MANLGSRGRALRGDAGRGACCFWNSWVRPADLVIAAAMYLLTRGRDNGRLPSPADPRSFQTSKPVEYLFAVLGSMAVQGPVDLLGRRPPQAPCPHRRGGRPAQPPCRARRWCAAACWPGLWHAHTGWLMSTQGRADWKRYAPDLYEDRGMRTISRRFVPTPARRPGATGARRLPGQRHPRRRRDRAALGRPGADLLRPPHHLERQFRLPFPRQQALRHRRSLDQRLLAGAAFSGRVLAPQPPRLPPLRRARAEALGDRTPRR